MSLTGQAARKRKQISETLYWLSNNFCTSDGVCIPRCILYSQYLEFCREMSFKAACSATFGKIIRQKFPSVTTRRLGTRGNSKYHYYGIGIKQSSKYFHAVYSENGLTRFSALSGYDDLKDVGETTVYYPSSRSGTLLPDLSIIRDMLNEKLLGKYFQQMQSFLLMYCCHCQSLLDLVVGGGAMDTSAYMHHFWHDFPDHLRATLTHEATSPLTALCDTVMYKVMLEVLIPAHLPSMDVTTLCHLRQIALHWVDWVNSATEGANLQSTLLESRKNAASKFSQSLALQVTLSHLAELVRRILMDENRTEVMRQELSNFNLTLLLSTSSTVVGDMTDGLDPEAYLSNFLSTLLHEDCTLGAIIFLADSIVQKDIIGTAKHSVRTLRKRCQEFLLAWSFSGARLLHELTLRCSPAFCSFHLLKLFLDEYFLFTAESIITREEQKILINNVAKYTTLSDANPTLLMSLLHGPLCSAFSAKSPTHSLISSLSPDDQSVATALSMELYDNSQCEIRFLEEFSESTNQFMNYKTGFESNHHLSESCQFANISPAGLNCTSNDTISSRDDTDGLRMAAMTSTFNYFDTTYDPLNLLSNGTLTYLSNCE